jgi:HAD superfamily hydrolase (TIGR01458 family)
MTRHRLVCLDIDGTLTDGVGGPALVGAVEAVRELQTLAEVRLVTNTTSRSRRALAAWLAHLGLLAEPDHLVLPARLAQRLLPPRGHDSGILLVEDGAREDFAWFREDPEGAAVLVASEAHGLRILDLQPAFRALLRGAALYTLQANRYYRKDGALVTDLGPIAALLGYAGGQEPVNLGKPSRLLFEALAAEVGTRLDEVLMAGDDAEFDASGAVRLGMAGLLVRTGKYRDGDEARVSPAPTAVLPSIADLAAWLRAGDPGPTGRRPGRG